MTRLATTGSSAACPSSSRGPQTAATMSAFMPCSSPPIVMQPQGLPSSSCLALLRAKACIEHTGPISHAANRMALRDEDGRIGRLIWREVWLPTEELLTRAPASSMRWTTASMEAASERPPLPRWQSSSGERSPRSHRAAETRCSLSTAPSGTLSSSLQTGTALHGPSSATKHFPRLLLFPPPSQQQSDTVAVQPLLLFLWRATAMRAQATSPSAANAGISWLRRDCRRQRAWGERATRTLISPAVSGLAGCTSRQPSRILAICCTSITPLSAPCPSPIATTCWPLHASSSASQLMFPLSSWRVHQPSPPPLSSLLVAALKPLAVTGANCQQRGIATAAARSTVCGRTLAARCCSLTYAPSPATRRRRASLPLGNNRLCSATASSDLHPPCSVRPAMFASSAHCPSFAAASAAWPRAFPSVSCVASSPAPPSARCSSVYC
mmetsp:Transcript_17222/g.48041  ORF Transcript_17222/g.48041 Transcript_17222/m.48041 type:complete len:440 (-) Transcript_17222:1072-2391(-)